MGINGQNDVLSKWYENEYIDKDNDLNLLQVLVLAFWLSVKEGI
jgi:hypothetical protein